ncbi:MULTISPECIES: winged helix-turn-helix domain-containing protein [Streptomyces]|uniref:ArsR/SmtB family transcription factor n=1 Tax=Streptomyces TaxID=1883 RepID=UPI0020709AC2|nr:MULTISPECIES: winged helix-turn-helix domain-containing protein [Streptomyces]UPT46672.1 winged helix-turn-helix domain-containing protein [Streptomyces sp. WAC00303]WIY80791.1 winged helix-turn-helix domain-containing protein [Streptomyces anulatus]WTF59605.1 winged helix-turn-helix domain-containing protein [Streptomyces anulatus]
MGTVDIQRADQDVGVDLAGVARLLADNTRAAFCLALLDGRAWTANELARYAGVAPSTATSHLNLLVNGGLLVEERHGRHRYVKVADRRVVELIESLAALAPKHSPRPRSLSASGRQQALARARLCYDHLAGTTALAITDAMVEHGLLEWGPEPGLTGKGALWLAETGITVPAGSHRPPVRACLDWTERRPHLAGAVGAALSAHALATGWMTRIGTTRALLVTPAGRRALHDHLGLPPAEL